MDSKGKVLTHRAKRTHSHPIRKHKRGTRASKFAIKPLFLERIILIYSGMRALLTRDQFVMEIYFMISLNEEIRIPNAQTSFNPTYVEVIPVIVGDAPADFNGVVESLLHLCRSPVDPE